jgi:RNA polymerase sigma-70 factor (ECF subfamily)
MSQPIDIDQLPDEQLIPLILEDQNLFVVITSRYKLKLFNYIRRLTNIRDEDAEDLLQDVFLKVYLNLNSFNSQMKFSSWIYAVARNRVISHYRKTSIRPEGHADVLDDQLANQLVASFDLVYNHDQKHLQEMINKALYRLKSKYRDVILLKYIEEKSYQEISDIIRKPVGTVGSMLNRAKDELKKNLDLEKLL